MKKRALIKILTILTIILVILGVLVVLVRWSNGVIVHVKTESYSRMMTLEWMQTIGEVSADAFRKTGRWPMSIKDVGDFLEPGHPEVVPDVDGWNHPLIYEAYETNRDYGIIRSYGRDGVRGGDGNDADIEVRFDKKTLRSRRSGQRDP